MPEYDRALDAHRPGRRPTHLINQLARDLATATNAHYGELREHPPAPIDIDVAERLVEKGWTRTVKAGEVIGDVSDNGTAHICMGGGAMPSWYDKGGDIPSDTGPELADALPVRAFDQAKWLRDRLQERFSNITPDEWTHEAAMKRGDKRFDKPQPTRSVRRDHQELEDRAVKRALAEAAKHLHAAADQVHNFTPPEMGVTGAFIATAIHDAAFRIEGNR